ncbi:MAG: histidine kinase [Epulopiscium sp.]|nr:histidine kinase [Candidatus Epulonipiscium sp.]
MKRHKKIFDVVNNIPLNKKLFLIYMVCVLIPIIITNGFFLNSVRAYVQERENQNLKISLNRSSNEIEDILRAGMDISQTISMDQSLHELLNNRYESDTEYYLSFYRYMRDRVDLYMLVNRDIEDIKVYTFNPTIISGRNYFYVSEEIRNEEWYKKIYEEDQDMFVYPYKSSLPQYPNSIASAISIFKKLNIYSFYSEDRNIIRLDINMNSIHDIMEREREYMDLILVDNLGRIICSTGKYEEDLVNFKNFDEITFGKDKQLMRKSFEKNLVSDWEIIGVIDTTILNKEINSARGYIFILMIITTLVSSSLLIILLRSYNYRVMNLSKHMLKVKEKHFDNIKTIEINEGKDEIGDLIRSFNVMASKINSLINDVYKLQLQKKDTDLERVKAELNFLQGQINPHFLFNTLNAIMVVCVKNNYTNVVEIIKYLSKIIRRLLSWKEDMITIEEEINFTEMYLKIEKFRFGEQFGYDFIIEEHTMDYKVPKMSIQTIVENACKHGLQAIKGKRKVTVTVKTNPEYLIIAVKDNGQGIESYRLKDIIENMKNNNSINNIGISNVYRRLKLSYGEEAELKIDSSLEGGTKVSLMIPIPKLSREGDNMDV